MSAAQMTTRPITTNHHWAQLPLFDRSKWETVRFGDVVELVSETSRNPEAEGITRYIGLEHMESGSLHIKTWGELVDGVTFTKRCRNGQVLFGKRRAYQRKVAVAEFDALVSGDIYVFQSKEELLDPKLLPFLCMSERFFQFAVETSAGSLSPRTNWSHLAEFEFALPPLDQQRRIAELLWAVDEVEQRHSITHNAALSYSKRLIQSALDVHQTTAERKPLKSLLDSNFPLCYGVVQPGTPSPDGVPFIRVCDMEGGYIAVDKLERVSNVVHEQYRRSVVKKDDVLVSVVGTIGRVAVVPEECAGFNIARAVARLTCSEKVLAEYLAIVLRTPEAQQRLVGNSVETARKTLNLSALAQLEIPCPPLKEQEHFIREHQRIATATKSIEAQQSATRRLRTALLSQVVS